MRVEVTYDAPQNKNRLTRLALMFKTKKMFLCHNGNSVENEQYNCDNRLFEIIRIFCVFPKWPTPNVAEIGKSSVVN